LKVTFTFTTPVVRDSEYPLHLDALLAWSVVEEAESFGADDAWAAANDLSHLLASESSKSGWVWKASALRFTPASERFLMSMIRKSDPLLYMDGIDRGRIEMKRQRSTINTGSGQERAYQFLMPHQWMEKAEAWCIGDLEMIAEALARLNGVGKLIRNGFGAIRTINIESDPQAETRWRLRVLPSDMRGAEDCRYVPALHCLRAPYWKKTDRILAMEPIF
jgi:CRISPR type IV-associated protein Csf3